MAENIEGSAENNILEVEDDSELKRKAMEKYTAFLETLDSNSLKNEVKSPSFEKNTQNFIEKSDAQVEGITISKFIIQLLLIVCDWYIQKS